MDFKMTQTGSPLLVRELPAGLLMAGLAAVAAIRLRHRLRAPTILPEGYRSVPSPPINT